MGRYHRTGNAMRAVDVHARRRPHVRAGVTHVGLAVRDGITSPVRRS